PIARSTTLPRKANSRNSFSMPRSPQLLAIDFGAQFLASLEKRNAFGFHADRLARARIASLARIAHAHGECAEATQFNAIAARQRRRDLFKHGVGHALDVQRFPAGVLVLKLGHEFRPEHEQTNPCLSPLAIKPRARSSVNKIPIKSAQKKTGR